MLDLSIIIINFNNCELLKECLDSIYKSVKKISFEIIVSDNGSTDGSQEMIRTKFPNVKLIESKENLGFAKASNLGLGLYKGRYAMLLNNDTIVKEDAFDRMISFMNEHPSAGACGPKLLNIDGSPQQQGGLFGKKFWKSSNPAEVKFLIGACLLVKRETIDKVGMLDENLFFYNDDLDWCLRIRKAGYKIFFLPQAEVIHYGGYSSQCGFNRKLFAGGFRGGLYFCRKHYGPIIFVLYRILLFFAILAFLPFFILSYPIKRENFGDRFFAYMDILRIALFYS